MRLSLALSAVISLATISSIPTKAVQASTFNEQAVNQNQFAVIAAPYRHGYNLVVVEQIPEQRQCWSESGVSPTKIDPLFLNFDFTNACKRSSDSNSYSIRFNGQDYGMDYLTDIVEKDGELHLVGIPRDTTKPQLNIGRTYGLSSGSLKIILNPEWSLTKRVYGNDATDHVYLSNSSSESIQAVQSVKSPTTPHTSPSNVTPQRQAANNYPGYQGQIPNYSQPVYQQPVYQQPVYQQPVYQQPVYQQPVYQQPMYQQPMVYPLQRQQ